MTIQRIVLEGSAIDSEIGAMSAEQLDALPFGAIKLDSRGTVLAYNAAEERLSGRKREDVVGRNFFRDIAPCTRVQHFHGAFEVGIARKQLNEVFDFVFRFPSGSRDVRIRMIYGEQPQPGVWIFVTPL